MTVAVGRTSIFAGANSGSVTEQKAGKNQHLREFKIKATETKGKDTSSVTYPFTEVSKSQLFSAVDDNTYQRVLRLSKPYPDQPQLGAVTTGSGKAEEIVQFDTAAPSKALWSEVTKKKNTDGKVVNVETADVDFLQTGEDEYLLAYCNAHDVFVKKVSSKPSTKAPGECVYITPFSKDSERPTVPKFSGLRWLTKEFILMLTNISNTGGVVLQILRLPANGDAGQARVVQSLRLPDSIKKATKLAVANLTPPPSPTEPQGYTQFIIAVIGADTSVSLFKVDYQIEATVSMVTQIKPFKTFKSDHQGAIAVTSVSFSNFTPPEPPITASTPPQTLKLASTGGNEVVVYTLPLFPVPLSVARGQSKTPRYVVALPSKSLAQGITVLTLTVIMALIAIFIQGFFEIRGLTSNNWLDATNRVPLLLQEAIGKPYQFPKDYEHIQPLVVPSTLPEIYKSLSKEGESVVYVQDTPHGAAEFSAKEEHHEGKAWEDLSHGDREAWKQKLREAGHWSEDMGETILKGVFFGVLGGYVGEAANAAMR